MIRLNSKAQTLMELVVGLGLITLVISALVMTTTYSSRNSQFSKNQSQATRYAQENLEQIRAIKNGNMGVCREGEALTNCTSWDAMWAITFNTQPNCSTCKFVLMKNCTVGGTSKELCLKWSATPGDLGNGFTYQIFLEDETGSTSNNPQKRLTSRVFWTDSTGQHSSDLATVFSKI